MLMGVHWRCDVGRRDWIVGAHGGTDVMLTARSDAREAPRLGGAIRCPGRTGAPM